MEPQKMLVDASASLPFATYTRASRTSLSIPRLTRAGLLDNAPTVSKAVAPEKNRAFTTNSRRLNAALEHLQGVLQGVDLAARRVAIQNMPPSLRAALTGFMLASRNKPQSGESLKAPQAQRSVRPGAPTKRIVTRSMTEKHKAVMNINALRMYTHSDLETVKRHSEVLADVRNALLEALEIDQGLWYHPDEAFRICEAVLRAHGTSERELGLGVVVSLRACKWLGNLQIISPSQSLRQALETQARLLRARSTSWEAFRAEWAHVMPAKRQAGAFRLLPAQALAIADKARQRVAEARVSSAVRTAARALSRESGSLRTLQRRQRRAALDARAATTAQTSISKLKRKRERDLAKERQRWIRRRDLTTEEVMRGLPARLQDQ